MNFEHLARFESVDYPVLSLYLNHDSRPGSTRARIVDLLKPWRNVGGRDHDALMSLRGDFDRIEAMADQIELRQAPSVALFACQAGGLFEFLELGSPTWDVAMVADRPYLRPLRSIRREEPVVAVVFDLRNAWIYRWQGEFLRLIDFVEEDEEHKGNYGGFSGYAEHGARNHADELAQRHLRRVAGRLLELLTEHPFSRLVVGGHQAEFSRLQAELHPFVKDRYAGSFVIDPRTMTEPEILAQVQALVAATREDDEHAIALAVADAAEAGGKGVLGLREVLEAVSAGAVDRLVVAGRFTKDGVVCGTCGRIGRNGESCAACGSVVDFTPDVVDAAIERVLRMGGRADQISVPSRLDSPGIGALLRYPVATR